MEEFDKGARVMDIKISNIIARGRSNLTQITEPLSETTPFPASIAAEFAYLADDEEAFYEELGGTWNGGEGGGGMLLCRVFLLCVSYMHSGLTVLVLFCFGKGKKEGRKRLRGDHSLAGPNHRRVFLPCRRRRGVL